MYLCLRGRDPPAGMLISTALLPIPGMPSWDRSTSLEVPLTASSKLTRMAVRTTGRGRMRAPPKPARPPPPPPNMCSKMVPYMAAGGAGDAVVRVERSLGAPAWWVRKQSATRGRLCANCAA